MGAPLTKNTAARQRLLQVREPRVRHRRVLKVQAPATPSGPSDAPAPRPSPACTENCQRLQSRQTLQMLQPRVRHRRVKKLKRLQSRQSIQCCQIRIRNWPSGEMNSHHTHQEKAASPAQQGLQSLRADRFRCQTAAASLDHAHGRLLAMPRPPKAEAAGPDG